jgi:GNAT superfamily N-acetyltransferase
MIVTVRQTRLSDAERLEEMQRTIFPSLTEEELILAENYRHQVNLFAEGQMVAVITLEDGREYVIGATSTFRIDMDSDHPEQHTFAEIVGENWFPHHNPNGAWLYGADVSVDPAYQRRGIGSKLYDARRALVKRLNLRGEIAGGMLPGYDQHRATHSIEQYVEAVKRGHLQDPTVSAQLRNGFEVRGVLYNYLTDPRSDNHSALIVRPNPDYRAG